MSTTMNKPTPLALIFVSLVFMISIETASAALRGVQAAENPDMESSSEQTLLDEMEKELGSKHRSFTNMRLQKIKSALLPVFNAMQKNSAGKLDLPAVNYVLRRTLLDRHAWFVKGLEPDSKSLAAFQDSDPLHILSQHVSENVTGMFESRFKQGLDMNEIAVLLASVEHLVHKESYDRLVAAYGTTNSTLEDVLSYEEASAVLDSYMALYLMGTVVGNVTKLKASFAKKIRAKINDVYPSFPATQDFVRDVQKSIMPNRDYFYLAEVMSTVDEIQDRYGRWQNKECLDLKEKLVAIEDQGVGGAGRVRLADFYDAALNKGRWEFVESVGYLRTMGALDDTDPTDLKVIIPNYVNGPTNCVAGTGYYSVCCIDECDGLLGHLEKAFGVPEVSPEQILAVVRDLPSSTISAGRTLAPWLVRRLESVAEHHGGVVPLHGRLFSQWMHYAYPRECTYPHRFGETKMLSGRDYKKDTEKDSELSQDEMRDFMKDQKPGVYKNVASEWDSEVDEALHSSMWTKDEELIVVRPPSSTAASTGFDARTCARYAMFLLLLGSVGTMLKQLAPASFSQKKHPALPEKFYA